MPSRFRSARRAAAASLLAAGAAASMGPGSAQGNDAGRLLAWIDVESVGPTVQFRAFGEAESATRARYSLKITRIGPSGRSSTAQGGKVDITEPDRPVVLSTTSVNIEPGARLSVELTLSGDDGSEARASLEMP